MMSVATRIFTLSGIRSERSTKPPGRAIVLRVTGMDKILPALALASGFPATAITHSAHS